MENIAIFDFDGTITKKDTLFDFIKYYWGAPKLYLGLIVLFPLLALYKIGLIKNNRAKEILFRYYFKGENIDQFNEKCKLYINRIDSICKKETLDKIKWHKESEHTSIIISASIKNWIEPWAKQHGFKTVLGTEIEVEDDIITGKFATNNCHGEEKVKRFREKYPNRECYFLYAYGDSSGDKYILDYSDKPTFIK